MTTPKDERVLDAIKNDAMMEEAIASAELAQAPKDERTWEELKAKSAEEIAVALVAEFKDQLIDIAIANTPMRGMVTSNQINETFKQFYASEHPAIAEIRAHTTALAEELVGKFERNAIMFNPNKFPELSGTPYIRLGKAIAIIRKHLSPDNHTS